MFSRRKFLTHGCSLGVASATPVVEPAQPGTRAQGGCQGAHDYRALVCVLLAGGNDSWNMVVPTDTDQHSQYQAIRSDLALPLDNLLPLPGATATGRQCACTRHARAAVACLPAAMPVCCATWVPCWSRLTPPQLPTAASSRRWACFPTPTRSSNGRRVFPMRG